IDSYNDFVERGLQAIVDEVGELPIEIGDYPLRIKLGKIEIGAPRVIEVDGTERSIYPAEARIRNLTYAAPLHMEMIPVIGEREGQPEMVYIGDLPVMLKSRICLLSKLSPDDLVGFVEDTLDPGGYFIVTGSELVSTDTDIQDELEASYEKSLEANNSHDALLYLGNRLAPGQVDEYRLKKAESVLDRNLLPHLGRLPSERREKGLFLTEIAAR